MACSCKEPSGSIKGIPEVQAAKRSVGFPATLDLLRFTGFGGRGAVEDTSIYRIYGRLITSFYKFVAGTYVKTVRNQTR